MFGVLTAPAGKRRSTGRAGSTSAERRRLSVAARADDAFLFRGDRVGHGGSVEVRVDPFIARRRAEPVADNEEDVAVYEDVVERHVLRQHRPRALTDGAARLKADLLLLRVPFLTRYVRKVLEIK